MSLAAFLSILAIHFLAAMSPGPSFVVSVRTAVAEGFGPAAAMAIGLGLGAMIWAGAAILGLAVLFQIAPALLTVMKIAGGAFLIWIAWKTWRHAADPLPQEGNGVLPRSIPAGIWLGLSTQLANPKPAIFFGAVFIGLVPADTPPFVMLALLALVGLNETLWYVGVARVFSLGTSRRAYATVKPWIDRAFGGLIAALGLKIAIT
ncbi:LysE family translocator [Profundibacterium mesophilum]|uniref:Naphthoate synthase n=1 Tax=Profundibacterium mesophilum KAUST100406-0324 TaxID=1037889 RepID=A0A921NS13_9RHOB|nr:LysE family transporter [Profundibacterium mesophilum]KAF0676712.1 naphthoate synthase [Profundibacterium mesophilum KAUST100406-0324]